jgi:hypothetical protein
VKSFDELPIRQASVTAMFVESHTKTSFRLALEDLPSRCLNICELQFSGIADVVIDAIGMPWLGKITAYEALPAGDAHSRPLESRNPLTRFLIDTSHGHFEVVAEGYSFAVLQRIPRAGD